MNVSEDLYTRLWGEKTEDVPENRRREWAVRSVVLALVDLDRAVQAHGLDWDEVSDALRGIDLPLRKHAKVGEDIGADRMGVELISIWDWKKAGLAAEARLEELYAGIAEEMQRVRPPLSLCKWVWEDYESFAASVLNEDWRKAADNRIDLRISMEDTGMVVNRGMA